MCYLIFAVLSGHRVKVEAKNSILRSMKQDVSEKILVSFVRKMNK